MTETELMLRAAFTWAKANDTSGMVQHAGSFNFCAAGSVKIGDRKMHCPLLWWEDRGRVVTVSTSPNRRVLHYIVRGDYFLSRFQMRLPRDFWGKAR